jgi:hypothetical protein
MRHHFRHPQAMFNKVSLFYSHCDTFHHALGVKKRHLKKHFDKKLIFHQKRSEKGARVF